MNLTQSISFPLFTGDNLVLSVLCSSFRVDVTSSSVTEEHCGNPAVAEGQHRHKEFMNTDAFRDLLISLNYLDHLSALQIMMFEEINETTFQENLNILVTH